MTKHQYNIHWEQPGTGFGGVFVGTSRFRFLAKYMANARFKNYCLTRGIGANFLRIKRENWTTVK